MMARQGSMVGLVKSTIRKLNAKTALNNFVGSFHKKVSAQSELAVA